jgi:predicted phosphoribosyltransferase
VASPDAIEKVRAYADEVVCLHTTGALHAISQFYRSFPQVEDDEVVAILRGSAKRGARAILPHE